MLTSGSGVPQNVVTTTQDTVSGQGPLLPGLEPGQPENVLIGPDLASNLIGGIAMATLILFLAAREMVVSFIQQESLNPERRALLLRLQSLLHGLQAPIGALLSIAAVLMVQALR